MDWKWGIRKARKIKNSLRTLFSSSALFSTTRGERVKNPSALNLPNHRHHLSPFVLSLSKYERTLRRFFKYLLGQ
ncbi:MAG: hypothetical protein LBD67_07140 [Candidatus Accumulibacter sp.]|nr:hypothetical protein [Accumulibacter sp.]